MQVTFLINLLIFLLPLTFFPLTSEIFEFNKIVLVYIFTIIISFFWAREMIIKKKIIFKRTSLDLPILIFLITQILSTINSIDIRTSIFGYYGRFHGGLLSYISYGFLYFAFVTFVDKKAVKKIISIILLSTTIAAVWGVLEHFGRSPSCLVITGNFDTLCFIQDLKIRVFATFGQPNWLAAALVAAMPLAWVGAIEKQKNKLFLLLPLLLFTALLYTKSRSGLLGFVFASVAFWPLAFYIFRKNTQKVFQVFSLTVIYCLLASVLIWNPFRAGTEPPVEGVTESADIRRIVWRGAVDLWKKYPILGTGVETFAYSYYETRPISHNLTSEWNYLYNKAHNEYLNFAATTGTIGLASYLLLIIASLITFFIGKKSLLKTALFAGYLSILVTNFFGFSTVTTGLLFFLFPALATIVESGNQKPKKGTKYFSFKQKSALAFVALTACYLLLVTARYWLADYYYAQGYYERAVSLSPNEPTYRVEYAKTLPQDESIKQLEFVLKKAPRNIKLLKSVSLAYADLEEYKRENQVLINILPLAPTDPWITYQLALSYGKIGDTNLMKEYLQKTLELKPDYKKALELWHTLD